MINFDFQNPCRILFGKGQQSKIGDLVSQYSKNVLLIYGKNSIKKNGIYDDVVNSLTEKKIQIFELSGVKPNPEMDLVYKGIEICKEHSIGFLLAVGGGSVIDTAKAVAVGSKYDGDVWDFYLRKKVPTDALPIGTVLTVVGAGSEMSCSNVITKSEGKLKRDFDNKVIIPKFSILNPEYTFTTSAYQTACGGFDAISHLLERYFSPTEKTDVTDRMIEGLLKSLITFIPLAIKEPTNYDYRSEVMWAATLAQNGLMNTGRDGDWACHKIEHELSGEYDIPHGEGLAMIYPSWLRYVSRIRMDRIRQLASRVFCVDVFSYDDNTTVELAVNALVTFEKSIGLKTDLKELNLTNKKINELSEKATWNSDTKGKYVKLTKQDISNILKSAS